MKQSQYRCKKAGRLFYRNRLMLLIVLLAGLFLSGCQKRNTPLQDGESEYQIYYMNQAANKLIAQPYRTKTDDTERLVGELVDAMLHVPADLDAQAVLSDKVVYLGCRQDDNVLYLFFDNNYTSMNACQEILCRAALARTLTQVPGIEYISIYSGDQPLLDRNGMPVGPISATDFVDSITDVNAYERTELTLYFTDEDGTMLYPEKRSVMHNVNTSVERVIIEELISGPEQPGLMPTLNSDIKILNVSVNENVCYVNFDAAFLNNSLEVKDYIPIYSIVNSLSELSNVNRVQITVNGSQEVTFRENISLNTLFERNLDYTGGN
ncbi:GerMN domain-containing protein [Clostridium sp. AF32-12BH]|uniref:GerMN domain-containing protein n=1 Tax=Clostridium sp. AF32-12BH TaxID=2292006 RepID=UPI000E4F0D67|nr:GerMN domain-containing protein [Clostridium sp. AF32-12BH]RHP42737.1 hypothetical protein DWZ40_16610 [Clostridium sp. AF32-12BH]